MMRQNGVHYLAYVMGALGGIRMWSPQVLRLLAMQLAGVDADPGHTPQHGQKFSEGGCGDWWVWHWGSQMAPCGCTPR